MIETDPRGTWGLERYFALQAYEIHVRKSREGGGVFTYILTRHCGVNIDRI
jgi:hypothetical protein